MVQKNTLFVRSQEVLTKSLKANSISITCSVRSVFDKVVKAIVPQNAKTTTFGTGVFKYVGHSWEDDAIFVGYCPALENGMIKFSGENAKTFFENFRSFFLNKEENKESLEYLVMNASFVLALPLETPLTKTEIHALFQKLLNIQKVKTPKLSIDKKGDFYIGGKTSANFICMGCNLGSKADDSSTTRNLRVEARIKAGTDFFKLLSNNQEVDFNVIASSLILKKISKVRVVGFLEDLRNVLISEHNIGKVVEVVPDSKKPTTKAGKTILRSLTTVKNKLKSPDTTQETQLLFVSWLNSFVEELKGDSQYLQFLEVCGQVFQSPSNEPLASPGSSPSGGGVGTATASTRSRAAFRASTATSAAAESVDET